MIQEVLLIDISGTSGKPAFLLFAQMRANP